MEETFVRITISADDAKKGFARLRSALAEAIEFGVSEAAKQLLADARPYVPMLTGALRDSGRVEKEEGDYAYSLVWDAANLANGYVYAARQYKEVFQHVDGLYAAKWIKRTLDANPGRYRMLAARYMALAMKRSMKSTAEGV